ncbi:Aldehyde dehydrogenase family [Aspergillus sp. HF37]|nr:Aldehyde dehydrogenase family [Aspergillus sp. HF37]
MSSLKAVREAAIDGRMHNIITRRTQLEALQRTLLDQADAIETAICHDTGHAASEVAVEYLVTLRALKECHQSLDVKRALQDEYAIARGEDAASRWDPVGIVYIVPSDYTIFNVVLLPNTLRAIPVLIRNILESSLDRNIIALVTSSATDEDLGPHHIRLRQDSERPGIVAAIVDRTADTTRAAEAIVAARFGFGGRSPYAPDVVLVNEFVKDPFLTALLQAAMAFRSKLSALNSSAGATQGSEATRFESGRRDEGIRLVSSVGRGAIFESLGQLSPVSLLESKKAGCHLLVHTVRSLEHAIDQSNNIRNLGGAYMFAHPQAAKYLSQFIASPVSFANHIPVDVLVGPPAPTHIAFNRSLRYPTSIFSLPRPQYISPTPLAQSMEEVLRDGSAMPLRKALARQSTELVLTTSRPLGGGVGFFEKGILTGLGLFSASMLAAVCSLGYWAWIVMQHRS